MLAKAGVLIAVTDLFGVSGRQRLAKVPLGAAYAQRMVSLLELIDILDSHEARFAAMIAERLDTHTGYQAIQQLPGIGPIWGGVRRRDRRRAPLRRPRPAVFVGRADPDATTNPTPSCAADTSPNRAPKLVRWAAVEAVQRHPTTAKIAADKHRIEARRGKNIAKVAAARKLLTLVYYGLRDGHIRALAHRQVAA